MTNAKRNKIITITVVSALLIIAWLCRIQRSGNVLGWIRCTIQCGLLIAWAVSVKARILNPHVKRNLIFISSLCTFWTFEVMVKYTVLADLQAVTLTRYAWYLYYVPLTLVPLLTLYSSLYVGKPEDYKISRKWYLLLIPALIGMGLVLTNDLHGWTFTLKNGMMSIGKDGDYSHNPIYYVIMGISLSEIVAFFVILLRKCRLNKKGKRIILPIVPILVLLVYAVVYIVSYDTIAVVAGDMKTVNVYSIVLALELCIDKGLFPSNTHYDEMFASSIIAARITDENFNTLLSSRASVDVSPEVMRETQNAPVVLDGNIRLSGKPIKGGYVLWTEDISELADVVSELEELDEGLMDKHLVLKEEYETRHTHQRLVEKNRLYNKMQDQTREQIMKLSSLIEGLKNTDEPNEQKRISAEIAVITAYLKRRNNLIFTAEENSVIPIVELQYCLKESLSNLSLFGCKCEMKIHITEPLPFHTMTALYDAFEKVIESVMMNISNLFVSASIQDGKPCICLSIICDKDLTELTQKDYDVFHEDENEWTVEYRYTEGGEAI